jgi:hypothetical protein
MRFLSYANVVSTCALFIAVGGGAAYAAAKVTGSDIVNRSVTGKDIKKHSVSLDRLKGDLVAGPQGQPGVPGQPGAPATRLWAVINSDGTTAKGSGSTSSAHPATGQYEVIFNQSVTACSYQVTLSTTQGEAFVQPRSGQPNGVFVGTYSSAGAATDKSFQVAVFC